MIAPIYFLDRVTVAVPDDVGLALRQAAEAAGVTLSDYARETLIDRLRREGVRVTALPHLRRHKREGGR